MLTKDYFESIDQVAATLAHEVKNPIAIVMANIDYLELADKNKRHKKSLQVMRVELKKITDILQEFMDGSPSAEANREPVNLNAMLADLLRYLAPCYGGIAEISFEPYGGKRIVLGDSARLHRVFLNLIKVPPA